MTDWLDELVSKTKQNYKTQDTDRAERLKEQELKTARGAEFFKSLKVWLRANTDTFNKKFASEVFSMNVDGPENTINIRSKPDSLHTWTATVTYTPDSYKITINRSPGDTATYSLALTKDWNSVVALYGNSTDVDHGFTVEGLGQNIMTFMLTG
jgi:hypothetical protein